MPVVGAMAIPSKTRISATERLRLASALSLGKALSHLPPGLLRRSMTAFAAKARPASYREAEAAVVSITQYSKASAGPGSCLQRSISVCILMRLDGRWPTWCVGVPSKPPFRAHAWIEAGGQIVAELGDMNSYSRLMTISTHAERTES
uniref:Lariatin biosynthetic protein n=1 Tax=Rhodococcus jostii TaxID=132919 RepID=H7C8I6_RHOJO|nr:lariatin biosynthetic protein [Rhodococcus jostii]